MTARGRTIRYRSNNRKPDGGWGHFRRPRRGQRKRPQLVGDRRLKRLRNRLRFLHGVGQIGFGNFLIVVAIAAQIIGSEDRSISDIAAEIVTSSGWLP
jgi:hypothetical protein